MTMTMMTMNMMPPLRRRAAVPATILLAAAAGCLLRVPHAPPYEVVARSLRARLMPVGEFVHYAAGARQEALRAALPCAEDPVVHEWWLRDIDYQQPGLCGGAKCFFLSVCDPARGYLIQADWKPQSYDVALDLEAKYRIKHFYASPPFSTEARRFVDHLTGEYVDFYKGVAGENKTMMVQPMIAAPEGSTIIRCIGPRRMWMTDRLEQVLRGTDETAKDRLIRDLEYAVELTKAEPKLINDFQLMVDPEGNVYHLDFDRARRSPRRKTLKIFDRCLDHAIEFVNALKDNDQDAKAKLLEKIDQWETDVYGTIKSARWKALQTRLKAVEARRKAFEQ